MEEDEGELGQCDYAASLLAYIDENGTVTGRGYCPEDSVQCFGTGECIDESQLCDGIIDCTDGSDEGRARNCTSFLKSQRCNKHASNDFSIHYADLFTVGVNVTDFHQTWDGLFKCNNGQCINAEYACDGQTGMFP